MKLQLRKLKRRYDEKDDKSKRTGIKADGFGRRDKGRADSGVNSASEYAEPVEELGGRKLLSDVAVVDTGEVSNTSGDDTTKIEDNQRTHRRLARRNSRRTSRS